MSTASSGDSKLSSGDGSSSLATVASSLALSICTTPRKSTLSLVDGMVDGALP